MVAELLNDGQDVREPREPHFLQEVEQRKGQLPRCARVGLPLRRGMLDKHAPLPDCCRLNNPTQE